MIEVNSLGAWGEGLAANFLLKRGYELLGQNTKHGYKELDIVAFKDGLVVFVEVKTRSTSTYGSAIDMIGRKKIKNIKFAALGFLKQTKIDYKNIRFDAIAVDVNRLTKSVKIKHYKDIV